MDAVLGWHIKLESVPRGTAELFSPSSAVPAGLPRWIPGTQDCVLGYVQTVPRGLNCRGDSGCVLTHSFQPGPFIPTGAQPAHHAPQPGTVRAIAHSVRSRAVSI